MDEGEVSFGEFVEASKDTSEVLKIAEHDLDFMAFFVEKLVGVALDRSCRVGRDDGFSVLCRDSL
jgi:hypothetical protein